MLYKITFLIAFFYLQNLYTIELPHPENDQLYTDFVSYRFANYLKKPIIGNGYIVMDGKNKFLFKQIDPINIEIRKVDDKILYKVKDNQPIEISNDQDENIMFIFYNSDLSNKNFDIQKKLNNNNKDFFNIIPKEKKNIINIEIISMLDKVEKITIYFINNSTLIYEFKNSITGKKPSEQFFK